MSDHADSPYPHPHPQRLVSDHVDTSKPQTKPNSAPSKLLSNYLFKFVLVGILLVLLPLFPSQAPEFVSQTILTSSWELVHLLFVGIAVSYGLLSRRNVEHEKENHSKFDTTQSYMSRILQVSSVFDNEMEIPSGKDENNIQTWNSQYYRGDSTVLVAEADSLLDEHNRTISRSAFSNTKCSYQPLQLPVRSLRSQVTKIDETAPASKSGGSSFGSLSRYGTFSRSGSGVKNHSNSCLGRTRSGENMRALDPYVLEEKLKESVVLPSPIPWRSRSGRFEMKDDVGGGGGGGGGTPLPLVGEFEFERVNSFARRSTIPWSSRPNSTSPSPRKLCPAPSFLSEVQAKKSDDAGKGRSYYKSSPPPPPPPPPPMLRKSPLMVSSSTPIVDQVSFDEKGFNSTRSFKNELKDFSRNKREDLPPSRMNATSRMRDSAKPEAKSRHNSFDGSSSVLGKSVRTVRANEQIDAYEQTSDNNGCNEPEIFVRNSYNEKNSREISPPKAATFSKYPKVEKNKQIFERVLADSDEEGTEYERARDAESVYGGGNEAEVFERNSFYNEKTRREVSPPKAPIFSKYPKEEKKKQNFERVLEDSDEEGSDYETNASQGNSDAEESVMKDPISEASPPNPNEVDKKAEEFIAKFREQISLQRIISIKRTSGKSVMINSTR